MTSTQNNKLVVRSFVNKPLLLNRTCNQQSEDNSNFFLQVQRYKKKKTKLQAVEIKVTDRKRYLLFLMIILVSLSSFYSASWHQEQMMSHQGIREVWKRLFDLDTEQTTRDTIDSISNHVYNFLEKLQNIETYVMARTDKSLLKIKLDYINRQDDRVILDLPITTDFDRSNVTDVLRLPFDLNNRDYFKKFTSNIKSFSFHANGIVICRIRPTVEFCVTNTMTMTYTNKSWYFNVDFDINMDTENIDPDLSSYDFRLKINTSAKNDSLYIVSYCKDNPFLILLYILTIASIYFDFQEILILRKDRKIEREFKIEKILNYKDFKSVIFKERVLLTRALWLFISAAKNILLLFHFILVVIDYDENILIKKTYKNYGLLLVWVNSLWLLTFNPKLNLIPQIFIMSFKNFTKSFITYISIACAFILVSTIVFKSSDDFYSLGDTMITIYSLMVGDSVLQILNDISQYGTLCLIYIIILIIFFVFLLQSLYITTVIDSFYTLTEKQKEETDLNTEVTSPYMNHPGRTIVDAHINVINGYTIEDRTYVELFEKQKAQLIDQQNALIQKELDMYEKINILLKTKGQGKFKREYNEELVGYYIEFLVANIKKHIKQVQSLKDHI